jgi:hypothetical protein
VTAQEAHPQAFASSMSARIIARWPRCSPSNTPTVTAAHRTSDRSESESMTRTSDYTNAGREGGPIEGSLDCGGTRYRYCRASSE